MLSTKLALAVTLSGFASFALLVPPSIAQELPRQPSTTVEPQQPSTTTAPQQPSTTAAPRQPSTTDAPQQHVRSPVTIKCPNGDHYQLTTGSNEGLCKVYVNLGSVIGGLCTDGSNSALQSCSTGCKDTAGSGGCEKLDPASRDNGG